MDVLRPGEDELEVRAMEGLSLKFLAGNRVRMSAQPLLVKPILKSEVQDARKL